MATKQNKQKVKPAAGSKPPTKVPNPPKHDGKQPAAGSKLQQPLIKALTIAGIVLVTFLFLKGCLDNLFTNWDDPGYVKDNSLIKDLSAAGLKNIFSISNPVMGNYHPLTILSYAIEYSYVRLEPWLYHFDSLMLHLLCTVLVYWLVSLLTRRPVAAIITALLFGLHPMHVESVAWIAGRKDVLYGAFYLLACIVYIYTLRATGGIKWLLYTSVAVLFVCALMAKPVAVSLPLTLLLIAYFEKGFLKSASPGVDNVVSPQKRKVNYRLLLEMIPFFTISVMFGINSVWDQKKFGALNTLGVSFNPLERLALGCYALVTYLWKAIAPVKLGCFYPYPIAEKGLPPGYYNYIWIVAILVFVVVRFARSNKAVVFGSLFFLANIGLLLQFIPVGGAILAERYTYIPYLGLFFMAGWGVSVFFEAGVQRQTGNILAGAALLYCCVLGYLAGERCKVWHDAVTLWQNEIEEHQDVPQAYNNLGFYYFNKFTDATNPHDKKTYYDSSYNLLNEALQKQVTFVNPYISLGELERTAEQYPEAKKNYYKALSLKSDEEDANAYLGLAIIYAINNNMDSSAYCFRTALSKKPYFPEAHSNYGNFLDMQHKNDSSLAEYGIAIAQNPDMIAPYLNRGRELQRLGRCAVAMKDFAKAIEVSPDNGEVYYARSFCYSQTGDKLHALQDVEKASSLGFSQISPTYYQSLKK